MVSFILAGAASFVSVMGVLRLRHVNWTPSPHAAAATLPVINARALPMICYHYRYSAAPTKSTPGFALKGVLGMRANSFLGSGRLVGGFWEPWNFGHRVIVVYVFELTKLWVV